MAPFLHHVLSKLTGPLGWLAGILIEKIITRVVDYLKQQKKIKEEIKRIREQEEEKRKKLDEAKDQQERERAIEDTLDDLG